MEATMNMGMMELNEQELMMIDGGLSGYDAALGIGEVAGGFVMTLGAGGLAIATKGFGSPAAKTIGAAGLGIMGDGIIRLFGN